MAHITSFPKSTKFLFLAIISVAFFGFAIDEAYAVHTVTTFVADDPDDGDIVYSVGDTLTISFSAPTNQSGAVTKANIDGNFTFALPNISPGATYTGTWADPSTLVITITGTGPIPTIGVTTVTPIVPGNNIGDLASTHVLGLVGGALSGDFGVVAGGGGGPVGDSGSGCSSDCTPPTLGVNNKGLKLVQKGFSYNGKSVDVKHYFTPYPLITVDVGAKNAAVFKIFENGGPQNISHFALAFGLAKGEIFVDSKAVIEWDQAFNGKQTVTVTDPENALGDVQVHTFLGPCRTESVFSTDCLYIVVYHTFRESLDFNMISTNVWDSDRNSWQNYYNDGLLIQGESINPPSQYVGIHHGHLVVLTETGKNTAIDTDGNSWTLDKSWTMDYKPNKKVVDGASTKWIDRNNAWFEIYKKGQELVAQEKLNEILGAELKYYDSLEDPKTIFFEFTKRSEDFELQQRITKEKYDAYELFKILYDIEQNH